MAVSVAEGALRFRGPTHVVIRGTDPTSANLAGVAVVTALDPEFALLEVRWNSGRGSSDEIPWGKLVPSDRHMITFAPETDASGETVDLRTAWPLVRADRPGEVLSHLAEFLAAPEAAEQALRRRVPIRSPMPILIANGRILAQQFPDEPAITGHLMAVQKQFGVSVVLVTDPTPRRDLVAFDVVFDVLAAQEGGRPMRLRCARAPAIGDLRAGDEIPLAEVKSIASAGELGSGGDGALAAGAPIGTDIEGARRERARSSSV